VLYACAELVKNYCVIYLVDISEVPDFNTMYELYDPCTVMFFYRNKVRSPCTVRAPPCTRAGPVAQASVQRSDFHCVHPPHSGSQHIMIDLGTGNNNKINWAIQDRQEVIDIIETVYRGARKGRGLVVSPKDYSTKYRY